MKLIFLGTGSGVGKTTVTALYCRYLHNNNVNVSPFKALNLSSNSYGTKDGKEVGVGQALQAWMAEKEPVPDMNPILLKPSKDKGVQTFIRGVLCEGSSSKDFEYLMDEACSSFDKISKDCDAIICEGSGSPVEMNLIHRDVANIGIMRRKGIPAILIGDIERGGVFAAIYGTWLLFPEDMKHLLKGFIINRFRGDKNLLKDGISIIENKTGMKCIGVLPYMEIEFPEEDSASNEDYELGKKQSISVFLNEMDEMLDIILKDGFDFNDIDLKSYNL